MFDAANPDVPLVDWPDRLVAVHHPEGTALLALGARVRDAERACQHHRQAWHDAQRKGWVTSDFYREYYRKPYDRAAAHMHRLDERYCAGLKKLAEIDQELADRIDDAVFADD